MDSIRQRRQQSEGSQEQNEDKSKEFREKPKKNTNFGFYLFLLLIFIVPLLLIPIIPIIRFDLSTRAHYVKLHESPKFEGTLSENDGLKNPMYFLVGKIRGAETIVFVKNKIYTGLLNGSLVEIDKDENIRVIAHFGPKFDSSCSKFHKNFCFLQN